MDEQTVLTTLIKFGLPIYGNPEERLERLYRNGIVARPDVQRFQEQPGVISLPAVDKEPEEQAEPVEEQGETDGDKAVGKPRGRPRKNEVAEIPTPAEAEDGEDEKSQVKS